MAWFTCEVERPDADTPYVLGEPGHRWLTALGSYCRDTAELDVIRTAGGVFDAPDPPIDEP